MRASLSVVAAAIASCTFGVELDSAAQSGVEVEAEWRRNSHHGYYPHHGNYATTPYEEDYYTKAIRELERSRNAHKAAYEKHHEAERRAHNKRKSRHSRHHSSEKKSKKDKKSKKSKKSRSHSSSCSSVKSKKSHKKSRGHAHAYAHGHDHHAQHHIDDVEHHHPEPTVHVDEPACEVVPVVHPHTGHVVDHEVVCDTHSHEPTEPHTHVNTQECEVVPVIDHHTGSVVGHEVVCEDHTAADHHHTAEPVCAPVIVTDPHTGEESLDIQCDIPAVPDHTHDAEPTCEVVPIVDTHTGDVVDHEIVCTPDHSHEHHADDHDHDATQHCNVVTDHYGNVVDVVCHDDHSYSAPDLLPPAPYWEPVHVDDNVIAPPAPWVPDHTHDSEPACELVPIIDHHTGAVVDHELVCEPDHTHVTEPACEIVPIIDHHTGAVVDHELVCEPEQTHEPTCQSDDCHCTVQPVVDHYGNVDYQTVCDCDQATAPPNPISDFLSNDAQCHTTQVWDEHSGQMVTQVNCDTPAQTCCDAAGCDCNQASTDATAISGFLNNDAQCHSVQVWDPYSGQMVTQVNCDTPSQTCDDCGTAGCDCPMMHGHATGPELCTICDLIPEIPYDTPWTPDSHVPLW